MNIEERMREFVSSSIPPDGERGRNEIVEGILQNAFYEGEGGWKVKVNNNISDDIRNIINEHYPNIKILGC